MSECSWPYNKQQSISFSIYGLNTEWNNVAGLYIFAYKTSANIWYALYIGQTNDFSVRLPNHERLNEAIRRGATHIHARVVSLQKDRDYYEEEMIQYLQPPMNDQLKKASNF
ncbi:MAG TPA: hypothetical protein VLX68_10625 [Chitinivibrionales bacterium]|nr:hypothetical protein [Chitinivibrionales bacterium]